MRKQKKQTIQVLRADLLLHFVRVFDLIRHPVLRSRHAIESYRQTQQSWPEAVWQPERQKMDNETDSAIQSQERF
jgi:hypothetical protein